MKSLKFNRKRIAICICFLFVIILSIISVQAFSFREQSRVVSSYPDLPSSDALPYLVSALQYQLDINPMGRGAYLQVIYIVQSGSSYQIYAILSKLESTVSSITVSGDLVTYSFGVSSQYGYNDQAGFFEIGSTPGAKLTVDSRYILYSDYTVPATSIPSFSGPNYNASFGSSNFNSFDVYSYFEYIYDSAVNRVERESTIRQEAQSEGESIGFEEGAEAGYAHGYDQGFESGKEEGYSEGESVGYNSGYGNGFDAGNVIGYETGFDDGYRRGEDIGYESGFDDGFETGYEDGYNIGLDDGYETGYSAGYETGYSDGLNNSDFNEPGQIIAQFWRYRDDSEYQGVVWFCTIEHNGVSGFRWCTEDEIFSHYLNCEIYDFVYETNLYFQNNPLEFNYFVPQVVRENSPYSGALSVANVEYRFVDLYNRRAVIELDYDSSITSLLNAKYNEGINDSKSLVNGVASIAKSPVESLRRALDFEIFGINIGAVAVGLVAILFAIWAYNKIRKLLPI